MSWDKIQIRGARVNNLKSVDLDLPLKKIICFAGPSGSGKTSIAFKTLLAESKRRLINSYPNSLRFFIQSPGAVDVDSLNPVLPVFGLPQINPVIGSRACVADEIGLTELLQNFFYDCSVQRCPVHRSSFQQSLPHQQFLSLLAQSEKELTGVVHLFIEKELFKLKLAQGILPSRVWSQKEQKVKSFDLEEQYWEIARFKMESPQRLSEILAKDESLQNLGTYYFLLPGKKELRTLSLQSQKKCEECDEIEIEKNHNLFSPLNSYGACPDCKGFGANLVYDRDKVLDRQMSIKDGGVSILNSKHFSYEKKVFLKELKRLKISDSKKIQDLPSQFWDLLEKGRGDFCGLQGLYDYLERKKYKPNVRIFIRRLQSEQQCQSCQGSRLNPLSHRFFLTKEQNFLTLSELLLSKIGQLKTKIDSSTELTQDQLLSTKSYQKLANVLYWASQLGLDHLSLSRKSKTLSAGEYQRVLLLKYLAFEGTDTLFVFDEPSVGLSEDQVEKLYQGLTHLKSQGNTIILVDHNPYFHKNSDHLVVMGEGAGHLGGKVIYQGEPQNSQVCTDFHSKFTAQEKTNNKKTSVVLQAKDIQIHSLKCKQVELYENQLHWVTGPSGSGKSSVFSKVIANHCRYQIHRDYFNKDEAGSIGALAFHSHKIKDIDLVDANLNRYTSRSTVGSLTDLVKPLRRHYLQLPQSKAMGLEDGHFSKNSQLGQCPSCEGRGEKVIELQYLEDISQLCEDCNGAGIQSEFAQMSDGQRTFIESMQAPLDLILPQLNLTAKYQRIYDYAKKLNLTHLNLERNISTLSGGEKQRIYLLSKLIQKLENTLLIFENLSFGLSVPEILKLGEFLQQLAFSGKNTLVIIDQNPYLANFCSIHMHFQQKNDQILVGVEKN